MEGLQNQTIDVTKIYDLNTCIVEHEGSYNPAELKKLSTFMRIINKSHALPSYASYETLESETLRQLAKIPLRYLAAILSAFPN